jgi:malic enzyme (fragment)
MRERENFGLKGLLPTAVRSQEQQAKAAITYIRSLEKSLTKYNYLRDIQDYNERLFYTLLSDYTEELMPIVYTPIVGEACIKYSLIYKKPRGLFISCHDAGHISSILNNWPEQSIKVKYFNL